MAEFGVAGGVGGTQTCCVAFVGDGCSTKSYLRVVDSERCQTVSALMVSDGCNTKSYLRVADSERCQPAWC